MGFLGNDPKAGIVGVIAPPGQRAKIFQRVNSVLTRVASTWTSIILAPDPSVLDQAQVPRKHYDAIQLSGPGYYRWRINAGANYWAVTQALRKAGRLKDVLTFSPEEQCLLGRGRNLFRETAWDDLRVAHLDLETFGLDPATNAIFLIGILMGDGRKIIFDHRKNDERAILRQFTEWYVEEDPDVLVGYNLVKFDLPFLVARAQLYRIPLKLGRLGLGHRTFETRLKVGERVIPFTAFQIPGRSVVDAYHLTQRYNASVRLSLPSDSQKEWAWRRGRTCWPGRLAASSEARYGWRSDACGRRAAGHR